MVCLLSSNDMKDIIICTSAVSISRQWEECEWVHGVSEPCTMSSLILFSLGWPVFPTLFSWVWGNHQEWALWSNPISRISSPIWAQPALRMDHRGAPWKHHQVWTAVSPPFFFKWFLFSGLDSNAFWHTFNLAHREVFYFTLLQRSSPLSQLAINLLWVPIGRLLSLSFMRGNPPPLWAAELETCIKVRYI